MTPQEIKAECERVWAEEPLQWPCNKTPWDYGDKFVSDGCLGMKKVFCIVSNKKGSRAPWPKVKRGKIR